MTTVETVIALGSNLGDRLANLRAAVAALGDSGVVLSATSSVWQTPPVPADQPPFLNAVVVGNTTLEPRALLASLKRIEHALGRRPERRWGPRPIDLDILFFGEEAVQTAELHVPHIRIGERAFVLAPLAEVVPGPLPVLGATALQLLDLVDATGLERTGLALRPPAPPPP